jgi:hypothetical protein
MPISDLPEEILASIFGLAGDEDIIFDKELPNAFSTTSLVRQTMLHAQLQSLNLCQRRSYATKKVCLGPFFSVSMTMVVFITHLLEGYHFDVQVLAAHWVRTPLSLPLFRRI